MEKLKKPIVAAVLAASIAASVLVARADKKEKCVIPDCDKTEKEVDCYETLSRPPDRIPKPYWVGCNVFPKELATGKKCLPVACTVTGEKKEPRELK